MTLPQNGMTSCRIDKRLTGALVKWNIAVKG